MGAPARMDRGVELAQSMNQPTSSSKILSILLEALLVGVIALGIGLRFYHSNWSQGSNLHPDEYGMTNTLTRLAMPKTLDEYFNTRLSPLSPYQRYDENGVKLMDGPDNRLRWGQLPLIIVRWFGEMTGQTGYDEIRLLGRRLSAGADTLSLLFLFLAGHRLYGRRVALLGTAFSALAVMQIQQSHFMTIDNFAALFTSLALFCLAMIASRPLLERDASGRYRPVGRMWLWIVLFGAAFGAAVACRINLVPLAGILLVAVFISVSGLGLRSRTDLTGIALIAVGMMALAGVVSLVSFRISQPMSFRAPTGDTGFFTLHINTDWSESMNVARSESSGVGGGPPAEQWANRPALIFPFTNMVLWGMGIALGLTAWGGFGVALWDLIKRERAAFAHLLPLFWVGGYFLFMGTRFVKSVRYFLPIYPFLCLLAAWALIELARRWLSRRGWTAGRALLAALPALLVMGMTLAWSLGFVSAVYGEDHTRIRATRWIFSNVPSPFHLTLAAEGETFGQPVGAPDNLMILSGQSFSTSFVARQGGRLISLTTPHVGSSGAAGAALRVQITADPDGATVLDETVLSVGALPDDARAPSATADFSGAELVPGQTYYLIARVENAAQVVIQRSVIANESWDEGLPFPFDNQDPFGQLYTGYTMEVRWYDDENKRSMLLEGLRQADYLILPSQRAIWSATRIPLTYPMTLTYYDALFSGELGFEQVAAFQVPVQIGPLYISDVGGSVAWGRQPDLPVFNLNPLAAEEAFSVYDHPPVWIFKKGDDFSMERAAEILNSVDLGRVIIQSPRDAVQIRDLPPQ